MSKPGIVRECEHPGKPHKHGLRGYRCDKCRCAVCRRANATDSARRRRHQAEVGWNGGIPLWSQNVGVARRLQALSANGWNTISLAEKLGVKGPVVQKLRLGASSWRPAGEARVHADTVRRVIKLYDELWDKEPDGERPWRSRADAKRRGWLPPQAWDDDSIDDPLAEPFEEAAVDVDWLMVDRAVNGAKRGRRLTAAERQAAMLVMARQGHTATGISNRLGVNTADARRVVEEAA